MIADFGCAIKLNDCGFFLSSLRRLARFFLTVDDPGVLLYQRTLVVMIALVRYWQESNLPIFHMLNANPTFFSEESGELALSSLTRILPRNMRADYEQTRTSWRQVKMRFTAANSDALPEKKHRFIRKSHLSANPDLAFSCLPFVS